MCEIKVWSREVSGFRHKETSDIKKLASEIKKLCPNVYVDCEHFEYITRIHENTTSQN